MHKDSIQWRGRQQGCQQRTLASATGPTMAATSITARRPSLRQPLWSCYKIRCCFLLSSGSENAFFSVLSTATEVLKVRYYLLLCGLLPTVCCFASPALATSNLLPQLLGHHIFLTLPWFCLYIILLQTTFSLLYCSKCCCCSCYYHSRGKTAPRNLLSKG